MVLDIEMAARVLGEDEQSALNLLYVFQCFVQPVFARSQA
jgi:hypothetical protein